jgi:8-oxo-dGTP pyrophosphatase MutT (NUDIX family)
VRWTVHGERTLYDSEWVRLAIADVELPDGDRIDYHVVRIPRDAAGVLVRHPERGILLLYRHRVVTDEWGWEVPGGEIDDGETPAEAAARETLEETGWRPGPLARLTEYYPFPGRSDVRFHLFRASAATHVGTHDRNEAERVEWLSVERAVALIRDGDVGDGLTLTALLWALAFENER